MTRSQKNVKLLFFVACCVFTNVFANERAHYVEKGREWLITNGARLGKVHFDPEQQGIVVDAPLKDHQKIFYVPLNVLLTARSVSENKFGRFLLKRHSLSDEQYSDSVFTPFLMYFGWKYNKRPNPKPQCRSDQFSGFPTLDRSSHLKGWGYYFLALPKSHDCPLLWTPKEYQCLEGIRTAEQLEKDDVMVAASRAWWGMKENLFDAFPEIFSPEIFTWQQFGWARLSIVTRSFTSASNDYLLGPFVDLINHHSINMPRYGYSYYSRPVYPELEVEENQWQEFVKDFLQLEDEIPEEEEVAGIDPQYLQYKRKLEYKTKAREEFVSSELFDERIRHQYEMYTQKAFQPGEQLFITYHHGWSNWDFLQNYCFVMKDLKTWRRRISFDGDVLPLYRKFGHAQIPSSFEYDINVLRLSGGQYKLTDKFISKELFLHLRLLYLLPYLSEDDRITFFIEYWGGDINTKSFTNREVFGVENEIMTLLTVHNLLHQEIQKVKSAGRKTNDPKSNRMEMIEVIKSIELTSLREHQEKLQHVLCILKILWESPPTSSLVPVTPFERIVKLFPSHFTHSINNNPIFSSLDPFSCLNFSSVSPTQDIYESIKFIYFKPEKFYFQYFYPLSKNK